MKNDRKTEAVLIFVRIWLTVVVVVVFLPAQVSSCVVLARLGGLTLGLHCGVRGVRARLGAAAFGTGSRSDPKRLGVMAGDDKVGLPGVALRHLGLRLEETLGGVALHDG